MPFGSFLRKGRRFLVELKEALVSRGRKKPSLRDLSNIMVLDDHIQDILHEIEHQSDRGAALIGASLADIGLRWTMRCRLVHFKDCDQILFEKEGAPLGSFADRIRVARAIGVIGPGVEADLDTIRRIRNQFAHSPLKIDFTHDLIAAEIEKLLPDNPDWRPEWTPQRRRYLGTIIVMIQAFDAVTKEHFQDSIPIWMH